MFFFCPIQPDKSSGPDKKANRQEWRPRPGEAEAYTPAKEETSPDNRQRWQSLGEETLDEFLERMDETPIPQTMVDQAAKEPLPLDTELDTRWIPRGPASGHWSSRRNLRRHGPGRGGMNGPSQEAIHV